MRKLLVLFSLMMWSYRSVACDFCNCYLGINPHFKKNSLSLRYTTSNYYGSHLDKTELEHYGLSAHDFSETRTNIELYAQYYPVQKLQLQMFVPYVFNTESMNDNAYASFTHQPANGNKMSHTDPASIGVNESIIQSSNVQGLGDPLLLANYQLYNSSNMDSTKIKQRIFAGGGIKFPIGKSELESGDDPLEKVHQPGTGSWDYLTNITYLAKYKKIGMNLNISYMIATSDKDDFRFANRFNANVNVYREFSKSKLFVYPSLGIYFEQAGKDLYKVIELESSGGSILMAHAGIDLYFRKFSITTAFHLPAMQQLNGNQPHMQYRCIAGLGYAFN